MLEITLLLGLVGAALALSYTLGYGRALRELKPRVDAIEKLSRRNNER